MAQKRLELHWIAASWFNQLINEDYTGNLRQMARYYLNFDEISVKGHDNQFNAEVRLSKRETYTVSFTVPKFSRYEIDFFHKLLQKNPDFILEIQNGKIPMAFEDQAYEKKLYPFSISFADLMTFCTCNHFRRCSHQFIAIVNFIKKIDADPYEFFKIKGFDLRENAANIMEMHIAEKNLTFKIKALSDISTIKTIDKPYFFDEAVYNALDYSVIKNIKSIILSLLQAEPEFHVKEFKSVIDAAYQDVAIGMNFYLNRIAEAIENKELHHLIEQISTVSIHLNDKLGVEKISYISKKDKPVEGIKTDFSSMLNYLFSIKEKNIRQYSPYIIALHEIYSFSLELITSCAYIPQIIKFQENEYRIRWIPAVINDDVMTVFSNLIKIMPSGIIRIESKNTIFQEPQEQLITICSLIINHFMSQYVDQVSNLKGINPDDPVFRLFFKNIPVKFSNPKTKSIPFSIQKWLNKFYLTHSEFAPVLNILENNGNFSISIMVEQTKNPDSEPLPLNQFYETREFSAFYDEISAILKLLAIHFKDINSIIDKKATEINANSQEFSDIFLKILPVIRLYGIKVLLPEEIKKSVRPMSSLSVKSKSKKKLNSYLDLEKIMEFDWQIAIGDQQISVDEFTKLVNEKSGMVRFGNQYVLLLPDEANRLIKSLSTKPSLTAHDILKSSLTKEYKTASIVLSPEVQALIDKIIHSDTIQLPANLNAILRPYQARGYEWLIKNSLIGIGSLIADDMGLGKTIQVIATLLKFKQEGNLEKKKALIVVPTTIITNWIKEIERFAPELNCKVYHGNQRALLTNNHDIIITTYGTVRSDITNLSKIEWHTIVIDEAQNIKNHSADQTKSIKLLKSEIKIAMTGTPVENRLSEYWSIFDFINKAYLGSQKQFTDEFAIPIQVYKSQLKLQKFVQITKPFILRRLKSDKSIISDLPDKIENNVYCSLSAEQAALYENALHFIFDEIVKKTGMERKGNVLKLITSLKQICNHPFHFQKNGSIKPALSGKTTMLFELLENIYENNEKVLIFTQYREMGELLVQMIEEEFKSDVLFLHGGLSRNQRDEMVDNFQNNGNYKIFILSLKAGGLGLNLTAARNVIHYDLWWNPAVEQQATDRAYRIGQKENVMVYRLITKGTFEERIDDMLKSKKELADLTVNTGEKWIGELDNDELRRIFKLGNDL